MKFLYTMLSAILLSKSASVAPKWKELGNKCFALEFNPAGGVMVLCSGGSWFIRGYRYVGQHKTIAISAAFISNLFGEDILEFKRWYLTKEDAMQKVEFYYSKYKEVK